jgi:hypothetical protein
LGATLSPFEYLLTFTSVILGLAVSDIAVSLNRLLEAGRRVKWDWLAPLAAMVAFLKIVTQWWGWFGAAGAAKGVTFEMYLGLLISTVLLFLLAASTLPGSLDEGETDLRAYYSSISTRFWLLFAAHWIVSNAVSTWIQIEVEHAVWAFSPLYLVPLAAVALAFVRSRWLQGAALIALIVLGVAQFAGHGLGR